MSQPVDGKLDENITTNQRSSSDDEVVKSEVGKDDANQENFTEHQELDKKDDTEISAQQKADFELNKLKNENQTLKDNALRVQAEFQNFKKRTAKEKSDIYKFANERIVLELLELMDNFDRAITSIASDDTQQSVLEGVNMMKCSLYELLQKEGVVKIEALGEEFNPNLHHAVMTESKDGCDSDVVIEEFKIGYKLNDKVIRPAMVKVSC